MQITQKTEPLIVFLLVDQENQSTPQPGVSPAVQLSIGGGSFADATNAASEIGKGWYGVNLTTTETANAGPIIVSASASGTAEWRDIVQVVPEIEAVVNPPDTGDEPTDPDPSTPTTEGPNIVQNGDFANGSANWNFYSNGEATWSVSGGESKIEIAKVGSNIQLYQYGIAISPGSYRLSFECKAQAQRNFEVYLHQHQRPYTSLGISDLVSAGQEWTSFEQDYQLSFIESDSRLRFWFARHSNDGDVFYLRNIQLHRLG